MEHHYSPRAADLAALTSSAYLKRPKVRSMCVSFDRSRIATRVQRKRGPGVSKRAQPSLVEFLVLNWSLHPDISQYHSSAWCSFSMLTPPMVDRWWQRFSASAAFAGSLFTQRQSPVMYQGTFSRYRLRHPFHQHVNRDPAYLAAIHDSPRNIMQVPTLLPMCARTHYAATTSYLSEPHPRPRQETSVYAGGSR